MGREIPQHRSSRRDQAVVVELTAVVVAVTAGEPRVMVIPSRTEAMAGRGPSSVSGRFDALPSGPLQLHHYTLDAGLRAWVEAQTRLQLGYVEQLYTFGDRGRAVDASRAGHRVLSIGYLALVREAGGAGLDQAAWQDWYRYFPWEDWRNGRPAILDRFERPLKRWASPAVAKSDANARKARLATTFGLFGAGWSDEHALDRYELLYEVSLVPEARRGGTAAAAGAASALAEAQPMAADHRRILATAISRLRGKIKYRPVVFELMPPTFTLLQLQRTVEALAGVRLHKQNFRRLVAQQGLVEETGRIIAETGGRPAREVRFRPEVALERLAPGTRLPLARSSG
ncbi:MAG: hypothetical protein U1E97_08580 [Alphaproteobacteria bacterium]